MGWRRINKYYTRKKKKRLKPRDGRKFEKRVEEILRDMWNHGEIINFERYEPLSREDKDGKDFSVTLRLGDKTITRQFGVTTSPRRLKHAQKLHPDVPQMYIPYYTEDKHIECCILTLFAGAR